MGPFFAVPKSSLRPNKTWLSCKSPWGLKQPALGQVDQSSTNTTTGTANATTPITTTGTTITKIKKTYYTIYFLAQIVLDFLY